MGDSVEETEDLDVETSRTDGKDGEGAIKEEKTLLMDRLMRKYSYKTQYLEWSSMTRRNLKLFMQIMLESKDLV